MGVASFGLNLSPPNNRGSEGQVSHRNITTLLGVCSESWVGGIVRHQEKRSGETLKMVLWLARVALALMMLPAAIILFQRPAHADFLLDQSVNSCANAYYGIGEKVDYKKAYRCFSEHGIWEFQILMQFNGQGVPKNPEEAKETLKQWRKVDSGAANSLDGRALSKAIMKREQSIAEKDKKISFCRDVAMTTPDVDFCSDIQRKLQEDRIKRRFAAIGRSLDDQGGKLWNSALATFDAYKRAESDRMFDNYACCTIRAVASNGQAEMVEDQFVKLMDATIGKHALRTATDKDLMAAKDLVATAYHKSIADFVDKYGYLNDADATSEMRSEYKDDLSSYRADIKKSQDLWEKLQSECEALVRHAYGGNHDAMGYANGIAVALSRNRVKALQYDPIGD